MRLLTSLLALFLLCSCTHVNTEQKNTVDPKAVALNDSALALYMSFDAPDPEGAIELLDQAIEIDPDYYLAHWNKYVFLNGMKERERAFETLQLLEKMNPKMPELKTSAGIFNEYFGDSLLAKEKFEHAENAYNSILDTFNKKSDQYDLMRMSKATNLVFLGKEQEGKEVLKELSLKTEDEALSELAGSYLAMSRQELFDQIFNGTR